MMRAMKRSPWLAAAAAVLVLLLAVAGLRYALRESPRPGIGVAAAALLAVAVVGLAWLAFRQRGRIEHVERALVRSETRAIALVEASPDGVVLLAETRIVFANRAFRQLIAAAPEAEIAGRDLLSCVAPGDRPLVRDWIARRNAGTPEPERLAFAGLRESGAEIPLEAAASLLPTQEGRQLALFLRDLTARRTIDDRLRHMTRLEALVDLGESVAREFDGIFRQIRQLAREPERAAETGEAVHGLPAVEAIERLASRGAALARRVRAVAPSAVDRAGHVPFDLLRLVREVAADFLRALPQGVSLRVTTDGVDRLVVRGDAAQLRHALWQVLDNAREAQKEGEIQLRTRTFDLDEATSSQRPGSRAGAYAVVEVRDRGPGMPEDVRERAIEPFFSTKGARASGLGLTIVFGTVRAHGGFVELDSYPGRGTLVRLALPRLPDVDLPADTVAAPDPRAAWRGRETVLVVDDDPHARADIRRLLEDFGYHVEVAGDPRGALSRLRQRPKVDLVVLDMVLPGMNGVEFLQRVLQHWPAQRVLMHSPYRLQDQEEVALRRGAVGVFTSSRRDEDLVRAVRQALDGPPPAAA